MKPNIKKYYKFAPSRSAKYAKDYVGKKRRLAKLLGVEHLGREDYEACTGRFLLGDISEAPKQHPREVRFRWPA